MCTTAFVHGQGHSSLLTPWGHEVTQVVKLGDKPFGPPIHPTSPENTVS